MKYLLIALLFLTACTANQTAPSVPPSTPEPSPPAAVAVTLKQVVDALTAANLPMLKPTVFDETTDPNKLLGRPNGYIEKMNFQHPSITRPERDCTVEVFRDAESAKRRFEYIDSIGKASTMFASYQYLHRNVLVRISYDLLPSEADAYKLALESIP